MKSLHVIGLLAVVAIMAGCSTTTSRMHPALNDELQQINTVTIVPPAVTVELLTLTGENERLTEKETELQQQLTVIAKSRLEENGFEVIDFDFEQAIQDDEEFAYAVTRVREGFAQAKKDLEFGKPLAAERANQVKTSVGEASNMLQAMSGADAILLISYNGFDKSEGHVAKDVATSILVGVLTMGAAVPVQPKSGAVTEVALLHGLTGEVLWADIFGGPLNDQIGRTAMRSLPVDVDVALADETSQAETMTVALEQPELTPTDEVLSGDTVTGDVAVETAITE